MKILFICDEYPPSPSGGIGTVTQLLAEGLQLRGHEIWIAGTYSGIHEKEEFRIQNYIHVYRLRKITGIAGGLRSRVALYLFVRKLVKKECLQIIEAPDFLGPCALWPPLEVPVIVRLHGSATYFAAEMKESISRMMFFWERSNLLRAKAIVSVSNYAFQKTQQYFKIKFLGPIIYNPIDPQPLSDSPLPLCRISKQVVFWGTMMRKKGVFSLIQAWPKVLDSFPDASLHFIGKDTVDFDGISVSAKLKALIPEIATHSICFHGHIDRKEGMKFLSVAELAVFPSYSETFCMAALEAVIAGCPIIFTKRSCGPEIFEDGISAILVDPDNINEIATSICKILSDPSLASRLLAEARKRIVVTFSLTTALVLNESFYLKVIKDAQSRNGNLKNANI